MALSPAVLRNAAYSLDEREVAQLLDISGYYRSLGTPSPGSRSQMLGNLENERGLRTRFARRRVGHAAQRLRQNAAVGGDGDDFEGDAVPALLRGAARGVLDAAAAGDFHAAYGD